MKRLLFCTILFGMLVAASVVHAVEPDEMLQDRALEARARTIGANLRCLVCQNQSIDDSDADLAHDLRVLIRQRLAKGESDQQVEQYIVARYGDYVLLKPPFKPETGLLWLGPVLFLLIALASAVMFYRRRGTSDAGSKS